MKNKNNFLGAVFFMAIFSWVFSPSAGAAKLPDLRVFNSDLNLVQDADIIPDNFGGIIDFAALDLGGDGIDEMAVAAGYVDQPEISLYRLDGTKINSWFPYAPGFDGLINLATGDLDHDGRAEIVSLPGEGGGPHLRIFDGFGQPKFIKKGFFVEDKDYRKGGNVALGDVDGNGTMEIVVSLVKNGNGLVKFYDTNGLEVRTPLVLPMGTVFEPLKIAVFDLVGDNKAEIVLGASQGNAPEVLVIDEKGREISRFFVYAKSFLGGFDLTAGKFDGDRVIVTAAGFSGGPHVRFFNVNGQPKFNPKFFVYDKNFSYGVNVALSNSLGGGNLMTLPETLSASVPARNFGKLIRVDLSEQRLYAYNRGQLERSFLISSGKRGFDTPTGTFSVFKKRENVRMSWYYGPNNPNNYDLPNVPHVLSFLGPYTIHGAYWHKNWGQVMSHGCVNVPLSEAKWIYDWAPIGTTVVVEK